MEPAYSCCFPDYLFLGPRGNVWASITRFRQKHLHVLSNEVLKFFCQSVYLKRLIDTCELLRNVATSLSVQHRIPWQLLTDEPDGGVFVLRDSCMSSVALKCLEAIHCGMWWLSGQHIVCKLVSVWQTLWLYSIASLKCCLFTRCERTSMNF
jgi:hypothetical protein